MKKCFTCFSGKRIAMSLLAMLATTISAFAGGEGYFDYYAELKAYPTGAGKVYAGAVSGCTVPEADGVTFFDFTAPAEEHVVKYYAQSSAYGYNATAVAADGWIFAGFSGARRNADGEFVFSDSISSIDNPAYLHVTATTSYDDEASALVGFPLVADTAHYALFTHVAPRIASGQATLGTVSIDKVCNNLGDMVTISASVENASTTRFDYWLNKTTGAKFTDNPLTLQVQDTAYYEAHFLCDSAIYVNFPAEGGFKVLYDTRGLSVPSEVSEYNFVYSADGYLWGVFVPGDSLCYDETSAQFYDAPFISCYSADGYEPHIFYGTGEQCFVRDSVDSRDEASKSLLRWSGETGVRVDTMPVTRHYYSVDLDNQVFVLLGADAVVEPNQVYMELDNARYTCFGVEEAPKVIYWSLEAAQAATGIPVVDGGLLKTAKLGTYTLDGKRLAALAGKGLYIVDGKKVVVIRK